MGDETTLLMITSKLNSCRRVEAKFEAESKSKLARTHAHSEATLAGGHLVTVTVKYVKLQVVKVHTVPVYTVGTEKNCILFYKTFF